MTPPHTGKKRGSPLVGMWCHSLLADGTTIEWQAQILEVDGDTALLQLYEWFMGDPTKVVAVPKVDLYNERRFILYASNAAMLSAYDNYQARRDRDE